MHYFAKLVLEDAVFRMAVAFVLAETFGVLRADLFAPPVRPRFHRTRVLVHALMRA